MQWLRELAWRAQVYIEPEVALDRLCERHAGELVRYAVTLTGQLPAAQDAVQEVFLRLAARPAALKDVRDVRPYLYRAVRNEALRNERRARQYWEDLPSEDAIVCPALALDERSALLAALRALPDEQREVVLRKEVIGETFREIAESLEISINTVASRHRYALARLRQNLTPEEEAALV